MKQSLLMVSYGGGTNSTAMLIEMVRRQVKPDVITFSDTGGERPEVYDFLERFSGWLADRGFPKITRVQSMRHGKPETLEGHCLEYDSLPSLAYGFKACSVRFKIKPQEVWMNAYEPAKRLWTQGGKVVKLIGYDADEQRRVKSHSDRKYIYAYPLIEWGWTRQKCQEVVKEAGFKPLKSACFFCPASKKHEVLELARTHPSLFERAVQIEKQAKLTTVKGLGRRFSWEDLAKADKAQLRLFEDIWERVPCGCYDG